MQCQRGSLVFLALFYFNANAITNFKEYNKLRIAVNALIAAQHRIAEAELTDSIQKTDQKKAHLEI